MKLVSSESRCLSEVPLAHPRHLGSQWITSFIQALGKRTSPSFCHFRFQGLLATFSELLFKRRDKLPDNIVITLNKF